MAVQLFQSTTSTEFQLTLCVTREGYGVGGVSPSMGGVAAMPMDAMKMGRSEAAGFAGVGGATSRAQFHPRGAPSATPYDNESGPPRKMLRVAPGSFHDSPASTPTP